MNLIILLSHFRTVIIQNGTKKLLKNILRSSFISDYGWDYFAAA